MMDERNIIQKTMLMYDKPFINTGKVPATNLFIFSLYLNRVLGDFVGAESKEDYKTFARLSNQIYKKDKTDLISNVQKVIKLASDYLGKPELNVIPLGIDEDAISAALVDSDVRDLCSYIRQSYEEDVGRGYSPHEEFMNLFYKAVGETSRMGGAAARDRGFISLDPSVLELVARILAVSDDDCYLDLVNGVGISTFAICSKSSPDMYLADNAVDKLILSEMLLAAFDKLRGDFIAADSLFKSKIEENIASKIFMDPPFKVPYGIPRDYETCEGVLLKDPLASAIMRACKALVPRGKAVIAVPGVALFGSQNGFQDVRRYIMDNHMLEAIITLPNCWSTMFVPTHLLVLSKKENRTVKFIDVLNDEKYTRRNGLTRAGLNYVYKLYTSHDLSEDTDFAVEVDASDVDVESFVPSAYFIEKKGFKYSRTEIDDKLDELYRSLGEIMRDIAK